MLVKAYDMSSRTSHYRQSRALSPEIRNQLTCVSQSPIAKYVLGAEFDNRIGAVVKHQIPRKIPGFKDQLGSLAELMIPSSSEHVEYSYSVFVLYKDSSNVYRLLPDSEKDMVEEDSLRLDNLQLGSINTIYEPVSHDDDMLFFFNITHSVESSQNERGRAIRSIAIGTPLRNFFLFKHLITATVQSYILDPQLSHLTALFNIVNSTDISLWNNYMGCNAHLHNVLALNYEFNNTIILSYLKSLKEDSSNTPKAKYKNGVLQFFSSYDVTSLSPQDSILAKIPFNFDLTKHPSDIITDLNVSSHILKFLYILSSHLNKVDYKNFNIVIYSNQSSDVLTSFILTLSNFLNGFDKSYFHNDKILYFPLIELVNWEELLKFNEHTKNTKIIGTNNIILKDYDNFFDFFYNLDSSEITVSGSLDIHPVAFPKTADFMELIQKLLLEKHDYNTVRISLQRFNIWEILKILARNETEQNELNLRDYYLTRNKNIVIFDEFFDFKITRLLDILNQFVKHIQSNDYSEEAISQYLYFYSFFTDFVTSAIKGRLEMFLYMCEIFPCFVESPHDLLFDMSKHFGTDKNLLSLLFKPIMIQNQALQSRILELYQTLKKSSLTIILEHRLNPFVRILLEEKLKQP